MEEKQMADEQEEKVVVPRPSREPLFGAMLFGGMALIVLGVAAIFGWGGYQGWRLNQERTELPSIGSLSLQEEPQAVSETPRAEEKPAGVAIPSGEDILAKAQGTEIKVLNGGATKGSATVVTEMFKKAGYTKVTAGNTIGNYAGTAVYFAADFEKEAEAVKGALLKTYPKTEVKPAVAGNKETTQAVLTVILGR